MAALLKDLSFLDTPAMGPMSMMGGEGDMACGPCVEGDNFVLPAGENVRFRSFADPRQVP